MRRDLLLVGGGLVVVQAAVLAAVHLPTPHAGGDNAAYLALGHALAGAEGYVELWDPARPPHTKYPPGYPLVLALMMVLGATTWAAFKTASALAISGATLLAFAWAGRRSGVAAAGALGLLLVLASGWQEASRWILSEPWFLLWTLLAFWAGERGLLRGEGGWLAAGGIGALLAFGIRSAGLPLVIAFGVALLLARRLRAAAVFGGASLLLVGGWLLRSRRGGEGAYRDEFWLRNPYEPELGTVGLGGLLERVWTNLRLYVGEVLPAQWWGPDPSGWLAVAGALVALLALAGWVRALRRSPGPAELFLPLYGGTILVWPEVWSGDRFLLPLLPLILLFAGEALAAGARAASRRVGPGAPKGASEGRAGGPATSPAAGFVLGAALLALALPALPGTFERAEAASACRERVEATGDVHACWAGGRTEYRSAAAWMGAHLPPDAVALSRKPRMLWALGGPPGRTFPFTDDPDALLDAADAIGARYLVVDRWDGLAYRYLVPAVSARPGAFCFVGGWGEGDGPGTQLLGILEAPERGSTGELRRCPPGWAADPAPAPAVEGERVPFLVQ